MREYRLHIFVCLGKRCSSKGSEDILDALKDRIKADGLRSEVLISRSGCMKACKETEIEGEYSPVVVVYPEGVWYRNVTVADVDEIVEGHIKSRGIVDRLLHFVHKGES